MHLMFRLKPRPALHPIPALAAALVFGVAFAAGQWQAGRAVDKEVIEARQAVASDAPAIALPALQSALTSLSAPEALDGHRVLARGRFLHDKTVYLDNQVHNHVAGYHVLTPMQTDSGATVLVNRGWVKAGASRAQLPVVAAPAGVFSIEGRIALPPKHIYEIKPEANPSRVWQNLLIPQIAQQAGLELPPYVLRQTSDTGDGLVRPWAAPAAAGASSAPAGMTAAKHRGYAFQWYALAALTVFLFLFFTFIDHGESSRNA